MTFDFWISIKANQWKNYNKQCWDQTSIGKKKKKTQTSHLIKTKSKWIIDLNVKHKSI